MAFLVAGIIILLTIFLGTLLAFGFTQLSHAVVENQNVIAENKKKFNQNLTMGYKIPVKAGMNEQIDLAVDLAAKRAAAMAPGANVRIGSLNDQKLKTNSKDLENDPVSAVKIAAYHGWDGAKTGPVAVKPAVAGAVVATGAQKMRKVRLVRGKDYAYTNVAPGTSGPERRNIHIANGKAIQAAYKALKESGADMVAVAAAVAAPAAAVATGPTAASVGIEPPDLIEISEGMAPADIRKARISNAKANSAYKKALKAAGITEAAPAVAAVAPVVAEPVAAPVVDTAGIEPPDLIEISDDMAPADIRKARISNAKANSAYKKALKAAGIDPTTVG